VNDRAEAAVFAGALALPPHERDAFLARACGPDAALRLAVESLLRAHDAAGDFFAPPPISSEWAALRGEEVGDRVGRYQLLENIGEGGCGIVFLADQREPIRRRVALKVIKLGMDTRAVIARFEAERQALARMDHPHIARVFDAGATESGRPFFVMEFVPGLRVTAYCDEHRLALMARLRLFAQICRAVHHAHQKGLIHRDLKPSNILVTEHDGAPVPKVIDFGIAKAAQGRLGDETALTAVDQLLGTPAYMSPEQLETGGLDLDTRSDIYALGVVLYELLTGGLPHAMTAQAGSGAEALRRERRDREATRPSVRIRTLDAAALAAVAQRRSHPPAKLAMALSGDLDWIVLRCLENDRARRYDSAAALALDLERHLAHEPVTAAAPSAAYVCGKFVRRHRMAFVTGGIVTAAIVAGLAVSTWLYWKERETLERARYAEQKAVEGFRAALAQKAAVAVREGQTVRAALDAAVATARREQAARPELLAGLLESFASVYAGLGDAALAQSLRTEAARLRP
jgi:tRNA A-37 threonylcarbamoyl transferase component Bud32